MAVRRGPLTERGRRRSQEDSAGTTAESRLSSSRMARGSRRSAHAQRRRRRQLRKRAAIAAGALLAIAVLVAVIIRPPEFLRSASGGPTPPSAASPSKTTPVPSPVSTPTLGSVTDVDETLKARIAVSGDTGMRSAAQDRVARRMALEAEKEPYDAFVIAGDMVYPDGDSALTRRSVIDPYKPVLKDAKLVPALGNHDIQSGEGMDIMRQLGRDSAWYVEKIGPVRVIVLDSNRVGNKQQLAWLRKVLAEDQPRDEWTLAVMHHPAYSAGDHGSDQERAATVGAAVRAGRRRARPGRPRPRLPALEGAGWHHLHRVRWRSQAAWCRTQGLHRGERIGAALHGLDRLRGPDRGPRHQPATATSSTSSPSSGDGDNQFSGSSGVLIEKSAL